MNNNAIATVFVVCLIVLVIIFSGYITVKCWNIPLGQRTGFCV